MNTSTNERAQYVSDEERWQAIVGKDRHADGKFFFSVETTGIYCRPSCPARPARREHVAFHQSIEDAERAGFRACQRCKPRQLALAGRQAATVAAACRAIETAEKLPGLTALASAAGMSRFHFHRIFRATTGLTPKAYAAAHRSHRMREELLKRNTVTEAIYEAGFNSNGRFYATSSQMLGMKPKDYRGGEKERRFVSPSEIAHWAPSWLRRRRTGSAEYCWETTRLRWLETFRIAFRKPT